MKKTLAGTVLAATLATTSAFADTATAPEELVPQMSTQMLTGDSLSEENAHLIVPILTAVFILGAIFAAGNPAREASPCAAFSLVAC